MYIHDIEARLRSLISEGKNVYKVRMLEKRAVFGQKTWQRFSVLLCNLIQMIKLYSDPVDKALSNTVNICKAYRPCSTIRS